MMIKKIIVLTFFRFFSCASDYEKILRKIEGTWIIENIKFLNQNSTEEFYLNYFIFETNKTFKNVIIPDSDSYASENALISLITENKIITIKIEALNKKINGIYTVDFLKNSGFNYVTLELKSETTVIKLTKIPTVSERAFN